jgi:hypothetical protein
MMTAMIEPKRAQEEPGTLRALLLENLAMAALIFALLEIWRPLYFLTDDNFAGGFPLLTGMGRRLAEGKSPFVADFIYGGNYDLLRDCTCFVWHPVYLLASLLTVTPAHNWIMDVVAFFFLMLAAAGFVNLAHHLRSELGLKLSDARLMLYTLSFTYSMIVLTTGSSWLNFLGNHSALPWLALGILQSSWRRGLGLVTLFSLHQILGGHLAATVSNTIFLSLFALGVAWQRRSLLPLISWMGGYALALVLLSPLLIPAWQGFLDADRAEGLTRATMSKFAIPASLFPFSYFFSTFSALLPMRIGFGTTQLYYASGFVSCAAAWSIIPALMGRAPWRGLELLCAGLVAFAALLVIRPLWVSGIMMHLPLLKSMRWPFREILQLQFFLHLFLVLRPPGGSPVFRRVFTLAGIFVFLFPLPFLPAPTFHPMSLDRELLFSGRSDRYWAAVKSQLGPDDVIVPVADPEMIRRNPFDVPFSLLGAYNFPILFKVGSATGYSVTAPRDQLYVSVVPAVNIGLFSAGQEEAISRERPNVKFITLESVHPLRITLSSRDGPTVDLTPLIPAN